MKHYTCDRCSLEMKEEAHIEIDHVKYDICSRCKKEIMAGLEGKGEKMWSACTTISGSGLSHHDPHPR